MAQQILNVSTPNSGLGDALRDASIKSNDNFTELYDGKVDKIVGKDLSDNNLKNTLVKKINNLEALAQVNVQSDWNENDILADAYIQNKPTQLFANLGYFDYADLATQTTPITVAPSTQTLLTNDTLGADTDISQAPFAVNRVYEGSTANEFDFSQLSIGDTVDIRFHFKVTTSANNQQYHIDLKAGIGSATEIENRIFASYVKTAGVDEQTFVTSFYIGSNDIKDNPAQVFIQSTQSCTVEVVGWFVRVFRKSVNIVELSDTIPLSDVLVNGNTTGGEDIVISDGDGVFMDNGSRLIKGVTDAGTGGSKGIALKCSIDYEYKWEAGRLYVLEQNGFTIRETKYNFTFTPTVNDDSTKGFVIGSRWILDNGDIYLCTDATTATAVWELQSAGVPDATTTVKGIIKLAGDLGGTASLPTVPDLVNKVDKNTAITGATKTKITYDSKGLVTAGADATTADIADSTNKRYVTDAQQTVIGNTSGTNTGDQDLSTLQPYAVASFVAEITFDAPKIFFNFLAPTGATLTSNLTGAKKGVVQKIYVNHATNPVTALSGWVNIGTGAYTPSVANIIFAEWTDGSRVEYWIVKA